MQTLEIELTNTEWTLVASDHGTIAIDIMSAGPILVHLNGSETPAIDAPGVLYSSWQDGPDAVFEGLAGSDSVWCRSIGPSSVIVVVRK